MIKLSEEIVFIHDILIAEAIKKMKNAK